MDQELIAYFDERFGESSRQIKELREETRRQLGEFREETTRRFERVDEAVRHTQVMVEGLRSDVQTVAEGVVAANERIDALQEKMEQEFKGVRSEMRHLVHSSYTDLDNRVRPLEEWRQRIGEDPAALVRRKSSKKA